MKTLLIAYHSHTNNTKELASMCYQSAVEANESINVIYKTASSVTNKDILASDAYVFATPENFAYMSGELKSLFDRTYYTCREYTAGRSYALIISCDNDGSGAEIAIKNILQGYNMKNTGQCLIAKVGQSREKQIEMAGEIGMYMAVALANGII